MSDNPRASARVNLHVERLVIHGLDLRPAQRAQFQAAFTQELARLISTCGVGEAWADGAAVPHAGAQVAALSADLSPGMLGTRVAQAVYRGIGNAPCEGERS
jgi:hypothetical protein